MLVYQRIQYSDVPPFVFGCATFLFKKPLQQRVLSTNLICRKSGPSTHVPTATTKHLHLMLPFRHNKKTSKILYFKMGDFPVRFLCKLFLAAKIPSYPIPSHIIPWPPAPTSCRVPPCDPPASPGSRAPAPPPLPPLPPAPVWARGSRGRRLHLGPKEKGIRPRGL